MKYSIEESEAGIRIRIDDVAGEEESLLQAIRECRRQSAWACPSAACGNIGAMEEHAEGGSVFVQLTPRPGVQLDAVGIGQCLCYALGEAAKA